jgi:hypothetical protein
MKILTEYLEHAVEFERLAEQEREPILREQFKMQANNYRKLAAERAERCGLPLPRSAQEQHS